MPIEIPEQSEDVAERRARHQKHFPNASLTVQADKDRCCVNNIMARFRKTGLVDHIRQHEGRYVDVATANDFQDAMNIVAQGQQSFELLPSEIRKRFDNDPSEFLKFVHDPDNAADLVKMGLATALDVEPASPTPDPDNAPQGQSSPSSGDGEE